MAACGTAAIGPGAMALPMVARMVLMLRDTPLEMGATAGRLPVAARPNRW